MSVSVKVRVPSLLKKKLPQGQDALEVEATTPLECLLALEPLDPKMRKWLYDEKGEIRAQVWFFINGEKIQADELTRALSDGDEVSILLAVSGG